MDFDAELKFVNKKIDSLEEKIGYCGTLQEIKNIKAKLNRYKKVYGYDCDTYMRCVKSVQAINELIKTCDWVKKDVKEIKSNRDEPRAVILEGDGYADGAMVYDTGICPCCGEKFEIDVDPEYNYCPNCGQKLKWSDKE